MKHSTSSECCPIVSKIAGMVSMSWDGHGNTALHGKQLWVPNQKQRVREFLIQRMALGDPAATPKLLDVVVVEDLAAITVQLPRRRR